MPAFTPIPHHDVFVLLIQITLLLSTARLLGEIALRFRQPAVVGEILAGIILGPSLLSSIVPFIGSWVMPHAPEQGHLLEVISMVGAMFLLLITGLETDVGLIRHHARSAIGASLGGIIVPFATGYALGQYLPDFLLADPNQRLIFALFIATAMSISAIPVIAKVLMDMNLMRRDVGQTILAAGMTDDAIGWMILSIVIGMASGTTVTVGTVLSAIGTVLGFMIFSFTIGRFLVKKLLDYVQDEIISQYRLLTLVVVLAFGWGAITQGLGLEAVFGAFVMGILLAQMPRLPEHISHQLTSIALGIFSPIFFAVAGLKVDVRQLLDPTLFAIALLVIAIATFGKVVGGYIGGRYVGKRDPWTSLAFGIGMNARGAMEIIIATIGLNLGILSPDMFSIIVVMAMTTSLLAPPSLKWVLARVQPEEQELTRLQREEAAAGSLIAHIHRVLIPVRGPANIIESAHLIRRLSARNLLSVTLLHITEDNQQTAPKMFLDEVSTHFQGIELLKKVVTSSNAAEAILREAQKDYDLMLLGTPKSDGVSEVVFTPMVDYLVRMSPCPTLIVQGQSAEQHWPPRQILVPTNGSVAARRAAELGFALANKHDSQVTILNVVGINGRTSLYDNRDTVRKHQLNIAHQVVEQLRVLGDLSQIPTEIKVQEGADAAATVIEVAHQQAIDLIILGTDLRPGTKRLFLGPRVERILSNANCPVVVFNVS